MKKLNIQNILKSLIKTPSVSGDLSACRKIIKFSKSILISQKVKSKIITIKNHQIIVWGEINLKKSIWLINSHLDVVPGKPEQFVPLLKNGNISGRGSADTKGNAAILLTNSYKWQNAALEKHITFMLVTDEEVGGDSTKEVLRRMSKLKGAVFLEPTDERIIAQAKGIIQLKIQTVGKSSHGSRPWNGVSALEMLTSSLTKFRQKHPVPSRETKNTTFNFSIFQSGAAINQIPNQATLWCDVRWNPKDNPIMIIKDFKKIFAGSKIEIVKLESPINCPKDSEILKDLCASIKKNHFLPIIAFEHGSSDARHCTAKNIPAIVFGSNGNNLQHSENEWVSLKSLENVTKILDTWISQRN